MLSRAHLDNSVIKVYTSGSDVARLPHRVILDSFRQLKKKKEEEEERKKERKNIRSLIAKRKKERRKHYGATIKRWTSRELRGARDREGERESV
jgi:hypothetical protein